jgi:hypothetical protein
MEKFEEPVAEQAPLPKNPEETKGFEDTFASFDNLKDLKQRLRDIAESNEGKLELDEDDGTVSRTEVGEITHAITAVTEEREGYTLKSIPGTKLREAVGRILENKKQ